MASSRRRHALHGSRNVAHILKRQNYLSRRLVTFTHNFSQLRNEDQLGRADYRRTCLWIKSCFGLAHRSGKWTVAEIYRRTLDGIPFFVDNEAEAPVLMKERQPIASSVLINSTLGENRDLSFAHPKLNERGLDIEPSSDDSCIDAEGTLFKLHYGHGLTRGSKTPRSPILSVSHFTRSDI